METKGFLGRGWGFPPQLTDPDTPTWMVEEEEDVRQSLKILLSTRKGERVFRPDYGTDVYQFVFEKMDDTLEYSIIASIQKAILLYEPRVIVDKIEIHSEMIQQGTLSVNIAYTIRSNRKSDELIFLYNT